MECTTRVCRLDGAFEVEAEGCDRGAPPRQHAGQGGKLPREIGPQHSDVGQLCPAKTTITGELETVSAQLKPRGFQDEPKKPYVEKPQPSPSILLSLPTFNIDF